MIKTLNTLILSSLLVLILGTNANSQGILDEPTIDTIQEKVSVEEASDYLKSCRNNFPRHFTPRAHDNYCSCSAATIRGTMTKEEFKRVKSGKEFKAGDKAYEKYIKEVVTPCMTIAIPDIAHVACLEDRSHNPYITSMLRYCECVSDIMALHVEKHGAASIIINMSANPKVYNNPIYALLDTSQYLRAKYDAQRKCTKRAKLTSTPEPTYGR